MVVEELVSLYPRPLWSEGSARGHVGDCQSTVDLDSAVEMPSLSPSAWTVGQGFFNRVPLLSQVKNQE